MKVSVFSFWEELQFVDVSLDLFEKLFTHIQKKFF